MSGQDVLAEDLLRERLAVAYSAETAAETADRITKLVRSYRERIGAREAAWVDERDVMLITYGDSLLDEDRAPLAVLGDFLNARVADLVSNVHILPCFPFTSDDGFSVIDFRAINPELGGWDDVGELTARFALMFDAVINHVSQESDWFAGFKAGDPAYSDWFITVEPDVDLSTVTRPRALPLLTPVETANGTKHVWTTFSEDQIDLNYAHADVLLEILDLLLFYAERGARFIRLDAIGFLWKEVGTSCMHLPQAHALIQVMRQVVDAAAPGTLLITETNVPHEDNISYFGDGSDEAHLVYQFPLPPLTLLAFQTGNARPLTDWASSLAPTSAATTYFNFLASHDGIGVRPVEGILSPDEVAAMTDRVRLSGGLVSMRNLPDGSQAPYELNIAFVDAVALPEDDCATRAAKFLAAQTILLSVVGVPGIYIHSLLGSRSDLAGAKRTGRNRTINRERLQVSKVEAELADPNSLRARVFAGMRERLAIRRTRNAFHPNSPQRVLSVDDRVFSLVRGTGSQAVTVAVNCSADVVEVDLPEAGARDLLSNRPVQRPLTLSAYQAVWLAD